MQYHFLPVLSSGMANGSYDGDTVTEKARIPEGMAVGHWPEEIVYTDLIREDWLPVTTIPETRSLI